MDHRCPGSVLGRIEGSSGSRTPRSTITFLLRCPIRYHYRFHGAVLLCRVAQANDTIACELCHICRHSSYGFRNGPGSHSLSATSRRSLQDLSRCAVHSSDSKYIAWLVVSKWRPEDTAVKGRKTCFSRRALKGPSALLTRQQTSTHATALPHPPLPPGGTGKVYNATSKAVEVQRLLTFKLGRATRDVSS